MSVYLDTSAAAKLLVDEAESEALAAFLDHAAGVEVIASSILLEAELRRLATREAISQATVSDVLSRIAIVEGDRAIFVEAGLLPGAQLRSLDALHLATAIRLGARVVAYDTRLLESAVALGLEVISPR